MPDIDSLPIVYRAPAPIRRRVDQILESFRGLGEDESYYHFLGFQYNHIGYSITDFNAAMQAFEHGQVGSGRAGTNRVPLPPNDAARWEAVYNAYYGFCRRGADNLREIILEVNLNWDDADDAGRAHLTHRLWEYLKVQELLQFAANESARYCSRHRIDWQTLKDQVTAALRRALSATFEPRMAAGPLSRLAAIRFQHYSQPSAFQVVSRRPN